MLGFSGVLVAVGVGALDAYRLPALGSALLAAGLAAAVFRARRYPTWDLREFRERVRSEAVFTELAILDTHIEMIEEQRRRLRRNTVLLGRSLAMLVAAAVLLVAGTIVNYLGG